jgi:hypothetical protein
MGAARPIEFTVTATGSLANLDVAYDTGIREGRIRTPTCPRYEQFVSN